MSAPDCVRSSRTQPFVAREHQPQRVHIAAAVKLVLPGKSRLGRRAVLAHLIVERVIALAADHCIVAEPAVDQIVARIAVDGVIAIVTAEIVFAVTTISRVITVPARDQIVAGIAGPGYLI